MLKGSRLADEEQWIHHAPGPRGQLHKQRQTG